MKSVHDALIFFKFFLFAPVSTRWHRIVAATSPGMTAQNATHGEPKAPRRPMDADSFHGILRTCRRKPTRRRQMRRDRTLIEAYRQNEKPRSNRSDKRFHDLETAEIHFHYLFNRFFINAEKMARSEMLQGAPLNNLNLLFMRIRKL